MPDTTRKAVVAGGNGVTGRAIIQHLETLPCWETVGLSRREPEFGTNSPFVAVDLLDRHDVEEKLSGITDATDLVYAAYQPRPSWAELVEPNMVMLRNVVEILEKASPKLRHVTLIQGGKVYGSHLGPYRTPAREDDSRHLPPEFYYDQEDYLRSRADEGGWTWSALRPDAIAGFAVGTPMNLLMVIGVYAAICRELGVPFRFPGKPGAYRALTQVTDARIVGQAVEWAATEPSAAGEAFNVTNSDPMRWEHVWPQLAEHFRVPRADPLPFSLTEFMADKTAVWNRIVERHGLRPYPFDRVASWWFGDFVFGMDYDNIFSTAKIRQHGFTGGIDTERMFTELFTELVKQRVLPPGIEPS
ncbi:SDR family oxidoreductase [Actinopolyspora mortivallis]|uniref:NAD-dependent dehydratase n=1 Tax=Actinopolyspora mortivallis TaxID=33906 RepID=A0A2T0GVA8_ACTMO|nr:SDR family oxidoreductase [Actinopolyspora mortivallis]PRW63049.1 NAD-dependent dehydratase [Actinopolyspora mortivallis]